MNAPSFRTRLRQRDRLVGTFVKTTSPHVVEILGRSGLDFLVLDSEHAPFDRRDVDVAVLAARAANCPLLVRVANTRADTLLDVLDLGATGVLAPHIRSAGEAMQVLAGCRYREGTRGFSNSARAGDYGALPLPDLVERSDAGTAVLCQIEDRDAVEAVESIAALDGIDCLFIGRADLTMSYGAASLNDPVVTTAVAHVCAVARKAGRPVGIYLADLREAAAYETMGVTLFLVGSDQSMLRLQGAALAGEFRDATRAAAPGVR